MAFLDVNCHQQLKFDWDDINVGNNQLDDSQNFFAKKHYKHERLDEVEFLQQKMADAELNDEFKTEDYLEEKENIQEPCVSPPVNVKCEENSANDHKSPVGPSAVFRQCEWSTKKTVCSQAMSSKGAVPKPMPPPPQAYLIKDIYQRKREEAERRRAEEERKLRTFHSRPAPNFNQYHEGLQKRKPSHNMTAPVTPQVLKKSIEAQEKRRKRLEEWKQQNQPPKFEPRPPTVLKEKPFVPEKKPMVVEVCPFKLHTEKRLQERKQYDEIKQKSLEEKQKQEEEERKRREKEQIKELRKAATFKARPNPFKH